MGNYFPYQSSFNTVLYVHKRYSKKPRKIVRKEAIEKNKRENEKRTVKEEKNAKCSAKISLNKKENKQGTVLQQTIKFAKNLVPLVIPPSEEGTPVFYTVKTCTKCKNTSHVEEKCASDYDVTSEKKKSKKTVETLKKEKNTHIESSSVDSTHYSQSNTLDDSKNNSISCTLSEVSDKREKNHKNIVNNKRKKQDSNKLRISESFECLATELNNNGETNFNIHIMNGKEKHFLIESIRMPIVETVNNRLKDLDNTEMKKGMKSIQRLVMSNSQKLDTILDRLTFIENYLSNAQARSPDSPRHIARKPSRLEQLSEDQIDEKEYSSEEELPKQNTGESNDGITVLHPLCKEKRIEDLGCGEIQEIRPSTSVGVRTERNRLPARFCWTDTDRNK